MFLSTLNSQLSTVRSQLILTTYTRAPANPTFAPLGATMRNVVSGDAESLVRRK
jgi:hypothetical protein